MLTTIAVLILLSTIISLGVARLLYRWATTPLDDEQESEVPRDCDYFFHIAGGMVDVIPQSEQAKALIAHMYYFASLAQRMVTLTSAEFREYDAEAKHLGMEGLRT